MVSHRTSALLVALSFLLQPASAEGPPVPRADAEFRELLPFVRELGRAHQGDHERFGLLAIPYADLQVGRGTHEEASILRNIYLGVAGRSFGVDARKIPNAFHCGPPCIGQRRSDLTANLERLKALVADFRGLAGIDLLSQWGVVDEYRVNRLFRIGGEQNEAVPSQIMGFVPSSHWLPAPDVDARIAAYGASPEAVHRMIEAMKKQSVVALVREPGLGVRLVRVGIGDNESGLLFLDEGARGYSVGDELADGRKIEIVEPIASEIIFYEST